MQRPKPICALKKILLTHGHLDHAGAAAELRAHYGVPIIGPHRDEDWLLSSLAHQGARYGMHGARDCTPDQWLEDGDSVGPGAQTFAVLHCPGYTPGHVVFFHKDSGFAFVGDVLFKGPIGRTDFPRGNYDHLIHAIRTKLFPLGDTVRFLPGHGEMSTFGWERKTNPFVSDLAVGA
jgi:glyoxylase-like metal-dependent hydrolase (beta-lactamase superfamily II)